MRDPCGEEHDIFAKGRECFEPHQWKNLQTGWLLVR